MNSYTKEEEKKNWNKIITQKAKNIWSCACVWCGRLDRSVPLPKSTRYGQRHPLASHPLFLCGTHSLHFGDYICHHLPRNYFSGCRWGPPPRVVPAPSPFMELRINILRKVDSFLFIECFTLLFFQI